MIRRKIHNITHHHWELNNTKVHMFLCIPRVWFAPWLVDTEKIYALAEVKETLETYTYKFNNVEDLMDTLDAWGVK